MVPMGDAVKIIAVSDVHLGTEKSNEAAFNEFLGSLHDDKKLTDLVLLGDILDMWHRDASGMFLENLDTIKIIRDLQSKIRVHWVAGNHDYHLLRLKNRAPHYHYPFEFQETLELKDGAHTYQFMHGYEFEYGSELEFMKPIMEVYCHVMSDSLLMIAGNFHAKPQERLKDLLEDIQKRAYDVVRGKPGQILVFGHTHQPFINSEENVVNSGSWVDGASQNNTYVELMRGKPRLFTFGGEEIKSRKVIV
jgi:UDP-2,3-diacylglucosamine pyrophosphatase LpxH